MGNSVSSYQNQHQSTSNNGVSMFKKMGRGWTHSYSNQLYSKKIIKEKVVPKLSSERKLPSINIYNDGTLNIHRTSALTLPHDLKKIQFNSKRCQCIHHHQLHEQQEKQAHNISNCGYCEIMSEKNCTNQSKEICTDIKKFKSEPDLRYLMTNNVMLKMISSQHYCTDQEMREQETRFRSKKKYKAPLPPTLLQQQSSKISPKKCRLFKTHTQSKISQMHLNCSSCCNLSLHKHCSLHETAGAVLDKSENTPNFLQNMIIDEDCQENINSFSNSSSSSMRRRRKFLNWKNKSALQRCSQSEPTQPSKKIRTMIECHEKGPTVESTTTAEKNQQPLHSLKNFSQTAQLSPQQRDKTKSINVNQVNSKINSKECPSQSNVPFLPLTDARQESLDKNRNILTKNQQKLHNGLLEFKNIKSNLLHRSFNDFNSKLLNKEKSTTSSNDGNSLKTTLMTESLYSNDKVKIDINQEQEKILKNKIHILNLKTKNDCEKTTEMIKRNGYLDNNFLESSKEADVTSREEGFDEEKILNKPLKNKSAGKEKLQLKDMVRRKNNLRGTCYKKESHEPISKMEKRRLNIQKEQKSAASVAAELESDYLNHSRNVISTLNYSKLKTFYFGMDNVKEFKQCLDYQEKEGIIRQNVLKTDVNNLVIDNYDEVDNEIQNEIDDIALRLRPTLPKKPPDVPKFSPSDAWKLLNTLETSEPMSTTVSNETPVIMLEENNEERVERLFYPPPPPLSPSYLMVLTDHRNAHDKSGDSGISGDAGAVNDNFFDVIKSSRRIKVSPMRMTWTPQQDLDEESSSSDVLFNSPSLYPLENSVKFPLRPHVFSLSLPREENRSLYFYNRAVSTPTVESKAKQDMLFSDSFQKLKRSVSGVLGFTSSICEFENKQMPDESNTLDDNWFLSSSAPTSLQNYYIDKNDQFNFCQSRLVATGDNMEIEEKEKDNYENKMKINNKEKGIPEFALAPSFSSQFISRGHVMYLPDTRLILDDSNLKQQFKKKQQQFNKYKKNEQGRNIGSFLDRSGSKKSLKYSKPNKLAYKSKDDILSPSNFSRKLSKSCENISYVTTSQENELFHDDPEHQQKGIEKNTETPKNKNNYTNEEIQNIDKKIMFNLNRPRKFTFQSTIRQIERRKLAEKLSMEAEAKEKQRKNELEAMIKVEEEFQKKRNKEKAGIKHHLRYYNMNESTK